MQVVCMSLQLRLLLSREQAKRRRPRWRRRWVLHRQMTLDSRVACPDPAQGKFASPACVRLHCIAKSQLLTNLMQCRKWVLLMQVCCLQPAQTREPSVTIALLCSLADR